MEVNVISKTHGRHVGIIYGRAFGSTETSMRPNWIEMHRLFQSAETRTHHRLSLCPLSVGYVKNSCSVRHAWASTLVQTCLSIRSCSDMLEHPLLFRHAWASALVQWDILQHPLLYSETCLSIRSCSMRHAWASALVQWDMLEHPLLLSETCLSIRSCSVRHASASALVK